MEFITTGNRIAVENFSIGKVYTIVWATGNYKSLACVGKGSDFVMFQDQAPDLLFCLTMDTAIAVESIDEGGGGAGTMNYNELENKPSINGFVLVGNQTAADLGLASQSDLEDYATNASVVAGLATKQDALSSSQLVAVNSGIDSAKVEQIETNKNNILLKQDALKIVDLKGTTRIDLPSLTWTQSYGTSGNGLFYTTIGSVSGISSIYCITVIGFGGINATSFFIPRTTNDGTGLMLMANNNFSTQIQAYIELRIVGI